MASNAAEPSEQNATIGAGEESKVSYQDIDSDASISGGSEADEDWEALIAQASEVYPDEKVEEMIEYLKQRGLFAFLTRFVQEGDLDIPTFLLTLGIMLPREATALDAVRILKIACQRLLSRRERLTQFNTVDDAVNLIRRSRKIMILTGAGVSTSCGIPDFRSPTGLYARLKAENWDLEDPQEMFDLSYFKEKPTVFYSFAKEIYPSNFVPSPCHRFVKLVELNDKLLRNYTQNIDGLFEKVGVEKILNCHGSFATASCIRCRAHFPGSFIEQDIFASRVPLCPLCSASDAEIEAAKPEIPLTDKWDEAQQSEEEDSSGNEWKGKPLVKPDIVFFGENLSDEFDHRLIEDREEVDLLIVIGTSLRVSPVSQIVSHIPHSVPQILINRDPITHANFDIVLLGDGDTIVKHLSNKLGSHWDLNSKVPVQAFTPLSTELAEKMQKLDEQANDEPERLMDSHIWMFHGANSAKYINMFQDPDDSSENEVAEEQTAGENKENIDPSVAQITPTIDINVEVDDPVNLGEMPLKIDDATGIPMFTTLGVPVEGDAEQVKSRSRTRSLSASSMEQDGWVYKKSKFGDVEEQ